MLNAETITVKLYATDQSDRELVKRDVTLVLVNIPGAWKVYKVGFEHMATTGSCREAAIANWIGRNLGSTPGAGEYCIEATRAIIERMDQTELRSTLKEIGAVLSNL